MDLSASLYQKRAVRAYQCKRERGYFGSARIVADGQDQRRRREGLQSFAESSEASQALEPAGQTGDTYAEYTHALDQSATLVIGGLLETEKSWPLTVARIARPRSLTGPIEVSNCAVMLFKYKVDDDYGVLSAEAHVDGSPRRRKATPPNPRPRSASLPSFRYRYPAPP